MLRDGTVITTTTATSYTDADAADGSHTYTVVAVDAAGNVSAASAGADVEVDTAAPVAPTGLVAAANPARLAPSFTWQAVADAVAYRLLRDGAVVAETSATAGADPERPADGEHVYGVVALDAAGNVSRVVHDRHRARRRDRALQVPALAARTPEREALSLAWLPVEDASAYQVYRDGAWAGTVSDGTRFVDLDVAADGSYSYTVSAIDEAGNEGLGSDPVTVVVDRTAPAAPAAPSAESPTASSPELTWPAVTGAVLYRCSATAP